MPIVGIDEVGRGCLAGPVVAAAVILKDGFSDERIKDSKEISDKNRKFLKKIIEDNATDVGIGIVCSGIIDKINILRATKQAMHIALSKITHKYDKVIIDAVKLNNLNIENEHPIKAENKHIQVAAASIIAKVYRDELMERMHYFFPEYNWYKNKGYGTKEHYKSIEIYGITSLHRITFL